VCPCAHTPVSPLVRPRNEATEVTALRMTCRLPSDDNSAFRFESSPLPTWAGLYRPHTAHRTRTRPPFELVAQSSLPFLEPISRSFPLLLGQSRFTHLIRPGIQPLLRIAHGDTSPNLQSPRPRLERLSRSLIVARSELDDVPSS
jgi:hypothetical protein